MSEGSTWKKSAGRGLAGALLAPLMLYGALFVVGAGCAGRGLPFVAAVPAMDGDKDGIPDAQDAKPSDHDNDDKDDAVDSDDDNDGIPDARDGRPLDHDDDGERDDLDPDDDDDGVPDATDAWMLDHDNDGLPDAEDGDDDGAGAAEPRGEGTAVNAAGRERAY